MELSDVFTLLLNKYHKSILDKQRPSLYTHSEGCTDSCYFRGSLPISRIVQDNFKLMLIMYLGEEGYVELNTTLNNLVDEADVLYWKTAYEDFIAQQKQIDKTPALLSKIRELEKENLDLNKRLETIRNITPLSKEG